MSLYNEYLYCNKIILTIRAKCYQHKAFSVYIFMIYYLSKSEALNVCFICDEYLFYRMVYY